MIDTDAMRRRAEAWLAPSTTRDTAINEEQLALDVIDLLAEVERLRGKLDDVTNGDFEAWCDFIAPRVAIAQHACDRVVAEVERLRATLAQPHHEWAAGQHSVGVDIAAEDKRIRDENDGLRARLAAAEAANASIQIVDHVELNGHIDIVEQCRDWVVRLDADEPSGKLRDFAASLRIVIDQLDRQRRQRNWYEVAYTAGKQKLIEAAVDKAMTGARDAARRFVALVDDLGAFADDGDPRVMALAAPIGEAQADLWSALGLDCDAEVARLREDIDPAAPCRLAARPAAVHCRHVSAR